MSRDITLLMWSKGHVALRVWASHGKSASYLVRCPWVFNRWRYNRFNLWRDVTKPSHWGVMLICGWEFSRYVTTLTSLVTIGIVKVEMILICHGTSRYHTYKRLKSDVTLWVEASHSKSPFCHVGGYWS